MKVIVRTTHIYLNFPYLPLDYLQVRTPAEGSILSHQGMPVRTTALVSGLVDNADMGAMEIHVI